MEKEKEAVKEKTDIKELETFLKDNTFKKFSAAIQGSPISSPHALADQYRKKHIMDGKSIGLPREIKYDINDKLDKSVLKNAYDRLSKKTREKLKSNYNRATIAEILEALMNFEAAILIADKSQELYKEMKKCSLSFRKKAVKDITNIDSLLENESIAKSTKDILLLEKKKLEIVRDKFKTVKTDEAGVTKLYDMFLDPMGRLHYLISYDIKEYVKTCFFTILEQKQGAPSKTYFKALQIIIYKLLAEDDKPLTVTHYIQWAKGLAATIINEFYERWISPPPSYPEGTGGYSATVICKTYGIWRIPKLTAKNIDQALHAS